MDQTEQTRARHDETLAGQARMKVLFVHGIGEIGGAERELLLYVDHLPACGWHPVVVCPEGGPLRQAVSARGVAVFGAAFPPWRKLSGIWKRFPSIWALRALLEAERPDVVHVNEFWWVPQTLQAMPQAMRRTTPVVSHFRQDLPGEKVVQYQLKMVDEVCAVSERVGQTVRAAGVEAARVHVVHSGLDPLWFEPRDERSRVAVRRALGIDDQAVVFVTAAHLFERKGYHVAIEAFAGLHRRGTRGHYVLVGAGAATYEQRLRGRCGELGISDVVHFVGFQEAVRPYLDAADVYLQPSLMEGFGIAVIEAMARGCPVIASDTGGLPDIVVAQETGRLVAPGDGAALEQAMVELATDAGQRSQWGANAKRRARERFSVDRMMAELQTVYEVAMKRRPAAMVAP